MELKEAIEKLDANIPEPQNKMVDHEHLPIAVAWDTVKKTLINKANKTISEWTKEVHENAKAHGWWENPRREGELLMLVTSEVAEAFEEIRNGHAMTETYYSEDGKMEGVPSELADIVIRIMDLCGYYGVDLEAAIAEKHAYNVTRPFKHGGKKL